MGLASRSGKPCFATGHRARETAHDEAGMVTGESRFVGSSRPDLARTLALESQLSGVESKHDDTARRPRPGLLHKSELEVRIAPYRGLTRTARLPSQPAHGWRCCARLSRRRGQGASTRVGHSASPESSYTVALLLLLLCWLPLCEETPAVFFQKEA